MFVFDALMMDYDLSSYCNNCRSTTTNQCVYQEVEGMNPKLEDKFGHPQKSEQTRFVLKEALFRQKLK